jgi:hypothetical protein
MSTKRFERATILATALISTGSPNLANTAYAKPENPEASLYMLAGTYEGVPDKGPRAELDGVPACRKKGEEFQAEIIYVTQLANQTREEAPTLVRTENNVQLWLNKNGALGFQAPFPSRVLSLEVGVLPNGPRFWRALLVLQDNQFFMSARVLAMIHSDKKLGGKGKHKNCAVAFGTGSDTTFSKGNKSYVCNDSFKFTALQCSR